MNHSKNPIVKTPTTTPREEEAIQRRLRRAADRIERSIRSLFFSFAMFYAKISNRFFCSSFQENSKKRVRGAGVEVNLEKTGKNHQREKKRGKRTGKRTGKGTGRGIRVKKDIVPHPRSITTSTTTANTEGQAAAIDHIITPLLDLLTITMIHTTNIPTLPLHTDPAGIDTAVAAVNTTPRRIITTASPATTTMTAIVTATENVNGNENIIKKKRDETESTALPPTNLLPTITAALLPPLLEKTGLPVIKERDLLLLLLIKTLKNKKLKIKLKFHLNIKH